MLSDNVLFIDAEAIVVDKPAGLPVDEPRDGAISVANHLESLRFTFQRWPTIVHRLDRDTSGCLLLARTPRAHKQFQAAFEAGTVVKRYLAVLDGVPDGESGEIALPLAKVSTREDGWRMVVDARKGKGKAASTQWRRVAVRDGRALILFTPTTGRTHQLRVHAATGLGIPIVGDPVYGAQAGRGGPGMLLHAWTITVPRAGKPAVDAVSPLPPAFAGWTAPGLDGLAAA
ncbi:MAG TPA: RluA family pseudouridine synthase [Sphingomonas sp.]|jgi:tRNA pseudouridine32 synthase/23S rRNA pseudouridine746 synthase|uniref:RluA family pseudouridine synthase n=1 Tax=Sphingomonas sp. TaxID=28214 RepID=UPI002EDAD7F2